MTKTVEEKRQARLESKRRSNSKHSAKRTIAAIKWAKDHPIERRRIAQNWRWRIRLEVIRAYGGKCVCCGEATAEFLTIDHIDGNGAEHRKHLPRSKQSGAGFYLWLREQGYPKDNYQLLCMNCNFAKGHFGTCPHQKGGD